MTVGMLREFGSQTTAMTHSGITPHPRDRLQPPASQAGELAALHFALGLAVLLPPDAIIAAPGPIDLVVLADPPSVHGAEAIGAVLGRPTVAVGSGHVFLDEVDRRLTGLVVRLNAYRVIASPAALVSTGLVCAEQMPSERSGATARELWELARETLERRRQTRELIAGPGDDALLAIHGGSTAQVAWLTSGRLATISVTSLQSDIGWAISSAKAIAECVVEGVSR